MQTAKKKSFLIAVVCLILCVALLVGTTFAWFTDSVSNTGNKIQAGTLDVDLLKYDNTAQEYVSIAGQTGSVFDSSVKWEPGQTQAAYLEVANDGSLALKYNIMLDITDKETNADITQAMADAFDFVIINGAEGSSPVDSWEAAKTAAGSSGTNLLDAIQVENPGKKSGRVTAAPQGQLAAESSDKFAVVLHMNEEAGNAYQNGLIEVDVNIVATQLNAELDGFSNPDYDKNATYPGLAPYINLTNNQTVSSEGASVTITDSDNIATSTVSAGEIQIADSQKTTDSSEAGKKTNYPMAQGSTLSRTIKTTGSTESSSTYDISYVYTEGTVSYNVSEFASIVTNELQLSAGLENVTVTHSHGGKTETMKKLDEMPSSTPAEPSYYYNAASGKLYIWSKSYSEFKVSYTSSFVASIGSTGYTSILDAIKGAQSGATINLIKDIELGSAEQAKDSAIYIDKSLILNLNGKTITVSAAQTCDDTGEATAVVVTNPDEAINVTIKNGTIKTTNAANGIIARKNANLTLTGLTVDQNGLSEANVYRHAAVTATEGAVVTVEDGTYSAAYYALYNKANGGKITVNGGTFTTKGQDTAISSYEELYPAAVRSDYATAYGNEIIINDGTFNVASGKNGGAVDFAGNYDNKFVINSGTFNGNVQSRYNALEIKGGTFNETIYPTDGGHCGYYTLSGGTFIEDPSANRAHTTIASGYGVIKADGKYSVVAYWTAHAAESFATPVDNDKKVVTVASEEELALFAKNCSTYNGYTVNLTKDMNLGAYLWQPVEWNGTFNGNNFTISNMTVNDTKSSYAGFFTFFDGTVKNVTFDKASVTGQRCGVVVAVTKGSSVTVDSVKVTDSVVNGVQKNGGLIGYAAGAQNFGCTNVVVNKCTVDGLVFGNELGDDTAWQCGAVIGYTYPQQNITVTDNTVKNISITYDPAASYPEVASYASHEFIGALITYSTKYSGTGYTVTISGNTIEKGTGFAEGETHTDYCGGHSDYSNANSAKVIINGEEQN